MTQEYSHQGPQADSSRTRSVRRASGFVQTDF
jgi:hypothetical protein